MERSRKDIRKDIRHHTEPLRREAFIQMFILKAVRAGTMPYDADEDMVAHASCMFDFIQTNVAETSPSSGD